MFSENGSFDKQNESVGRLN